MNVRPIVTALLVAAAVSVLAPNAHAVKLYNQGFEVDVSDWDSFLPGIAAPVRVPTGTNGIPSSAGVFHAELSPGAGLNSGVTGGVTRWGGYNLIPGNTASVPGVPFPSAGYSTSLDIYLDVDGGFANDTRVDFSSAINRTSTGAHLRDFAFHLGFYDDATGPGAGTDRFVISASNTPGRANSFPKNPGRDPIAIDTTGWYTFEHHFRNAAGVLAVDLVLLDSSSTVLNTWTLSDLTDTIPGIVSANRYGWVLNNEFSLLAVDEAMLIVNDVVPEPITATLGLIGLGGMAIATRRRRSA